MTSSPAPPKPPVAAPRADALTGFGATRGAWAAHHVQDTNFDPGSAYDKTPGLAYPDSPQNDDRYYGVVDGDRITSYSIRFAPGTLRGEATHFALGELPADARLVWQQVKDICFQQEYRSATLTRLLGAHAGVLFQYTSGKSGDHYDPRSITEAIVGLVDPASPPIGSGC